MVMDAMRMNQGNASQCSIVGEEPKKIMMNYYGMAEQITVNYRSLHRCLSSSRIID
jgi:hypothetical protein